MAPLTVKRTPLQEHRRADPGTVIHRESLNVENKPRHPHSRMKLRNSSCYLKYVECWLESILLKEDDFSDRSTALPIAASPLDLVTGFLLMSNISYRLTQLSVLLAIS